MPKATPLEEEAQVEAACTTSLMSIWAEQGIGSRFAPGCGCLEVEIHKAAAHIGGRGTGDVSDDNQALGILVLAKSHPPTPLSCLKFPKPHWSDMWKGPRGSVH